MEGRALIVVLCLCQVSSLTFRSMKIMKRSVAWSGCIAHKQIELLAILWILRRYLLNSFLCETAIVS